MRDTAMTNIENQGNVSNQTIINIQNMSGNIGTPHIVMFPQITTTGDKTNTSFAFNTKYYNLIVTSEEKLNGALNDGFYIIETPRALTECMSPETMASFSSLDDETIAQIKTFPSIFASENHSYDKTDDAHLAYFGLVTGIAATDNGVKIHFKTLSTIPQQRLNEIGLKLAIKGMTPYNDLNRCHWIIKRINLLEELRVAGISVLAPT